MSWVVRPELESTSPTIPILTYLLASSAGTVFTGGGGGGGGVSGTQTPASLRCCPAGHGGGGGGGGITAFFTAMVTLVLEPLLSVTVSTYRHLTDIRHNKCSYR